MFARCEGRRLLAATLPPRTKKKKKLLWCKSTGNASNVLERDVFSDTPEECTTGEIAEPAPLRRSSRIKRPVPHCYLCDYQIREEVGLSGARYAISNTNRPRIVCICCNRAIEERKLTKCASGNVKFCCLTKRPPRCGLLNECIGGLVSWIWNRLGRLFVRRLPCSREDCPYTWKNFKLLFSAGIILTVEVSISYFRPMRMIYPILLGWLSRAI